MTLVTSPNGHLPQHRTSVPSFLPISCSDTLLEGPDVTLQQASASLQAHADLEECVKPLIQAAEGGGGVRSRDAPQHLGQRSRSTSGTEARLDAVNEARQLPPAAEPVLAGASRLVAVDSRLPKGGIAA